MSNIRNNICNNVRSRTGHDEAAEGAAWPAFVPIIQNHAFQSDDLKSYILKYIHETDPAVNSNNNNTDAAAPDQQNNNNDNNNTNQSSSNQNAPQAPPNSANIHQNNNQTLLADALNHFAEIAWKIFSKPEEHLVGSRQAKSECIYFSRFLLTLVDSSPAIRMMDLLEKLYVDLKNRFEQYRASLMTLPQFVEANFSYKGIAATLRCVVPNCPVKFIASSDSSTNFNERFHNPGFLVDARRMIGRGVVVKNNVPTIDEQGKLEFDPNVVTILASPAGTGKTVTALLLRPSANYTTVCAYILLRNCPVVNEIETTLRADHSECKDARIKRDRLAFKTLAQFLWEAFFAANNHEGQFEQRWKSAQANLVDGTKNEALTVCEINRCLLTVFSQDDDYSATSRLAITDANAVFHIVADAIGPFPTLLGGFRSIWPLVSKAIATCFRVREAFLTCVGTTAENFHRTDGTEGAAQNYQVYAVSAPDLLNEARIFIDGTPDPTTKPFVRKVLDLVFRHSATNKPQVKIPTATELAMYRLIQLCSNTRCFGIIFGFLGRWQGGLTKLDRVLADAIQGGTVNFAQSFQDTHESMADSNINDEIGPAQIRSILCSLKLICALRFASMSGCGKNSFQKFGMAVWTALNRDESISSEDYNNYVTTLGLLGDSSVPLAAANIDPNVWTRANNKRDCYFRTGQPRFVIGEAEVAILLLNASDEYPSRPPFLTSIVELQCTDFLALRLLIRPSAAITQQRLQLFDAAKIAAQKFVDGSKMVQAANERSRDGDQRNVSSGGVLLHSMVLAEPHILFCNPNVTSVLRDFSTHKLEEPQTALSPEVKLHIEAWGTDVRQERSAVVIRNADRAKYADVIVLSPGILFLTKIKSHLESAVSAQTIGEEFDTMCFESPILLDALRQQCMVNGMNNPAEVLVVASVVVARESSLPEAKEYPMKIDSNKSDANIMQFIVPATLTSGINAFYPLGQVQIDAAKNNHLTFLESKGAITEMHRAH